MKINFTALAAIMFFSFCLPAAAFGQQARLEGNVYEIANGRELSVAGVRVIAPGGQSRETDSKGHFIIDFPNSVQAGQAARIEVSRPGWLVRDPFFGECSTQNTTRNFELLKVIIVPKGSPLALEPKQLSKVIARWANERVRLREQVTELGRRLDEYAFLREYAEKYGFTLEQFRNAADKWANSKKASDDLEAGWKEYWKKNYGLAAQLGASSKNTYKERLRREKQERLEDGRNFIRSAHLEGNARYAENDFRAAMTAYQEIETAFNERELVLEDFQLEWAVTKNLLGIAKSVLGTIVEGRESRSLLGEAVAACREALKVFTREQSPQDWAATQNNLGNALIRRGERAEGAEGVRLLGEAVAAYREALKVFTREQSPQDWAMTQNNLGGALSLQGERAEGAEGVRLLGDAMAAYREALKVHTREQTPQRWAKTQNNLGGALRSQGERAEGAEGVRLVGEAVAASREALKVYTREQTPQGWAKTQNNLGNALRLQGERAGGAEGVRLLDEAVAALREALNVFTRDQLPQPWAMTQNNLGIALILQGERAEGADGVRLLGEAVAAFREALKVRTREHLPQGWVSTQNNLAKAYVLLRNWLDAAEVYANVLTFYPNREDAYARASAIYHDRLFKFEKAFSLNQQWLAQYPDDLSAQVNFAEKYFTTARFDECERRINALLAAPGVSASAKSGLRAIDIASLLALNQVDRISPKMEALIAEVSRQPAEFKVEWVFDGTRHFISQTERLSPYRDWLDKLFDAIGGKDRETILKGLKEAKESFKTR